MRQYTRVKIAEFFDRKADQYPGLDLKKEVPTQDRMNRFL